jgi:hypothetical protein
VTIPGQSNAVFGWIGLPRVGEIVRKVGDFPVPLNGRRYGGPFRNPRQVITSDDTKRVVAVEFSGTVVMVK